MYYFKYEYYNKPYILKRGARGTLQKGCRKAEENAKYKGTWGQLRWTLLDAACWRRFFRAIEILRPARKVREIIEIQTYFLIVF